MKPDDVFSYNNRAGAKYELGLYEDSIFDFNKAIQLDPSVANFYSNRAQVQNDLEQYEAAIEDCNEAIRLDPDCIPAYVSRGEGKKNLGQVEHAKLNFQTALELADRNGEESLKVEIEQVIQELAVSS